MKKLIGLMFLAGLAHGANGEWRVIQKSSNSISFVPAGKYVRGHEVEIYDGERFVLGCFIPDNETSGWCGHKKTYMTWKTEKHLNWINPSTDEVRPGK